MKAFSLLFICCEIDGKRRFRAKGWMWMGVEKGGIRKSGVKIVGGEKSGIERERKRIHQKFRCCSV